MLAAFKPRSAPHHPVAPALPAPSAAPDMETVFKASAFEGSAGAMMTVDRDLKILHVNESTRQLLRNNAAAFRAVWPTFNPDVIIGTCIDIFHKAPSHQRQILADPGRLPFKTDITIGNLKFALHVTAVFDSQRNYVGNVLQWDDVTAARLNSGMLAALNRSQAIIEFTTDGTILNANDNFLNALGYRLDDIKGRHHRMFVDPSEAALPDYGRFWDQLRRGEYQSGEYKRIGSGNKTVWIHASYNPILDANGQPMKVVKFATDITASVEKRMRNEKLSVQIESDLSGIADNISNVSRQASEVAGAASQTTETIQSVAAAAEELTASINEISSSVASSKRSVEEAHRLAQSADASTAALTKTAQQMTGIVELIDDIASQINLLALNATIESARAGEAGRGFAVVAAEVKQLAAQVSAATKTISSEIHGVQSVSADVVSSLKAIQGSVNGISNSISEVAAAVQQQSSATSEISATMQMASSSVTAIDRGMGEMAGAMSSAANSTELVRGNMQMLVK